MRIIPKLYLRITSQVLVQFCHFILFLFSYICFKADTTTWHKIRHFTCNSLKKLKKSTKKYLFFFSKEKLKSKLHYKLYFALKNNYCHT